MRKTRIIKCAGTKNPHTTSWGLCAVLNAFKCLKANGDISKSTKCERMHDMLREYHNASHKEGYREAEKRRYISEYDEEPDW